MSILESLVKKIVGNTDLNDVEFTNVTVDGIEGEVTFQGLHCGLTISAKIDLSGFIDDVDSLEEGQRLMFAPFEMDIEQQTQTMSAWASYEVVSAAIALLRS